MSARSCSSRRSAARAGQRGAAGAGRRRAPVGIHRRHRRRDRLPARHLDGRLAPPGLARGLRGLARRAGDLPVPAACGRASAWSTSRSPIPAPSRVVLDDVSLTLPAGAVVAIVGENGAGKIDAGQAAGQIVRAHVRRDPGRRSAAGAHARRRVARAAGRRVPGLLPLRIPGPAHRRPGRRPAPGRRARRRRGRRSRGRGRRGRSA